MDDVTRSRLQRLRQEQQANMIEELNQLKSKYVSEYPMPLKFPARVSPLSEGEESTSTLRTDHDFVNARLLEAGLPLDGGMSSISSTNQVTLADHGSAIARFIHDLEGTGCYDTVQVHVGNDKKDDDGNRSVDRFDVRVKLKEKNWYKLYIGGGVNADELSAFGSGGAGSLAGGGVARVVPKLQFETSASLLNITGFTDVSSAIYTVDQCGASSFKFTHDRPLCSWFPKNSWFYKWLMPRDPRIIDPSLDVKKLGELKEYDVFRSDDAQYTFGGGSQTTLGIHALFHELDYESIRSSKEFTRSIGVKLANHCRGASRGPGVGGMNKPSVTTPDAMAGPYLFLDWGLALKDVLPRRHAGFPFALDCSNEVSCQTGTSLRNSVSGGLYLNGSFTDDRYAPTIGYDAHLLGDVSGPPGDVGFWKMKGGFSWHMPLELLQMMIFGVKESTAAHNSDEIPANIGMTLHSSLNAGIIRPLTFGGLCINPTCSIPLSDRFYIGGPCQLRGFIPAGIGPRASKGGSNVPGGDSLGGDLFYTAALATSIPFPIDLASLHQNRTRLFGFVNAGTCVSSCGYKGNTFLESFGAFSRIMYSSRVAVGGGLTFGTDMGRFEATYTIPVRYGPKDATKSVQFGFGLSFG